LFGISNQTQTEVTSPTIPDTTFNSTKNEEKRNLTYKYGRNNYVNNVNLII